MEKILLASLLLTGCLMDPEKKPDHIINVDCRNSFDYIDSAGIAHYSCLINPPKNVPDSTK